MGAGIHGGFGKTFGAVKAQNLLSESKLRYSKQKKEPIFTKTGHVTDQSISARAEFFLGNQLQNSKMFFIDMDMRQCVDRQNTRHQKQK